jgi:tRNA-binding protein
MAPAQELSWDQFEAVDIRVGRVTAVDEFPEARRPAWKLTIDFGPEIGSKRSSAQITNYERSQLDGRLIVAVVNFPPKRIGPFVSEVLVLGAVDDEKGVILLAPDQDVALGGRVGEADVLASDGDELVLARPLSVERADLGVDERDEIEVAAIEEVREPASIPLARQGEVADDPAALGLEHDPFHPALHHTRSYRHGAAEHLDAGARSPFPALMRG